MTTQTLSSPLLAQRPAPSILAFLAGLAKSFAFATSAQGRFDEILRLQALDDDALARLGIAREEIVRHVYRDLLNA